jgi:OPA family glycerol-3-phosphate transporter-like MFS transporter
MIYMALVMVAVFVYWTNMDNKLIDGITLVAIGFLIYGPVLLISVHALDVSSKNAAGVTVGFTGFFGYFFGTSLLANFVMGRVVQSYGWNSGFQLLIAACLITIALMVLAHWLEQRSHHTKQKVE